MDALPSGFARALVVGAHPDDAEYYAGATLAALIEAGTEVHVIVSTDGAKGGWGMRNVVETRQAEQAMAAKALGVAAVTNLGFPDGSLQANDALVAALVGEIRRVRPDLVLGHDPRTRWTTVGDRADFGHSDHRAVGQAVLDAVYPRAASPAFYPESEHDPWSPREVWLFDTAEPNLVVDATTGWPVKTAALAAHASQEAGGTGLIGPATELARRHDNGRLSEAFVRLKLR